jgi:hypothetical protein
MHPLAPKGATRLKVTGNMSAAVELMAAAKKSLYNW